VELTNVVLSALSDNFATAPETKPDPVIVNRKACPPASIGSGDAPVMTGAVAAHPPVASTADRQHENQVARSITDS
jgi:hypothetical protein